MACKNSAFMNSFAKDKLTNDQVEYEKLVIGQIASQKRLCYTHKYVLDRCLL